MKIMFASDIHGSDTFCERLIAAFEHEKPEKLILLGDLLYHGPRNDLPCGYAPKKVIERLNAYAKSLLCVRGNCDTEVDQMVLSFPILSDYAVVYTDGITMYLTHGHVYSEDKPPILQQGDFLICGHTHVPACNVHESFVYLNPGSVSIPKENSHHGYMVYEDRQFIWKDLDGNHMRAFSV